MNKEMQKLLKAINDKKNEVKSLVNDGKLDKARSKKNYPSCGVTSRRNSTQSRKP